MEKTGRINWKRGKGGVGGDPQLPMTGVIVVGALSRSFASHRENIAINAAGGLPRRTFTARFISA